MASEVVGWLQVLVADDSRGTRRSVIEICGNEQFYLGRDMGLCRYTWCDDLTISRLHLRIHCILYDQDLTSHIAPFVYATDLSANGTYLKKNGPHHTASQTEGVFMGRNNTFLLDYGDELSISDNVTLIYLSKFPTQAVQLTPVQQLETRTFSSRYLLTTRMLGEGAYGKVLVSINKTTRRQLACKIVRLDALAVKNLRLPTADREQRAIQSRDRCYREFNILKDLSHPNIIALEKVFCGHESAYIFQELITGGDLLSFLEFKGGRLDSTQTAAIVFQILKGVEYLHGLDVVHRDLKPDNILMSSLETNARVVITDFGNPRFLPEKSSQTIKNQRMFSHVGTLEYAAPEIFRANPTIPVEHGYSKSIDMWSIGSLTATILSGDHVFTDRDHPDYHKNPQDVIVRLAAICDLSIVDDEHHPSWKLVGSHAKDFIKKLLILSEHDRMTASEALAHPWFKCHANNFEEMYARSITDWKSRNKNVQLVENISELIRHSVPIDSSGSSLHKGPNPFDFPLTQHATKVPTGAEDSSAQHLSARSLWKSPVSPAGRRDSARKSICSPTNRLLCSNAVVEMEYNSLHGREDISSKENLKSAKDGYPQLGASQPPFPFPDDQREQDSILVSETPIEKQECLEQRLEQMAQDSILVSETPPEFLQVHVRFRNKQRPNLLQQPKEDEFKVSYDAQDYARSKRPRLLRHGR